MKLAWAVFCLGFVGARARYPPSHVLPRDLANRAPEDGLAAVLDERAGTALNATAMDCQITVPPNPLTAAGLATPYILQPPCSMAVSTQQSFAEAAVFDPATNTISIYHPLVINAGTKPAAAPVVPNLPAGAVVGLWFGFNGGVLTLIDGNGQDANNSPALQGANCINGLKGVQNDVFGQVSWCNAEAFFAAANAVTVPPLGTDSTGQTCPTSRSFAITDACPSDNVPTQYLLLPNGQTAQDTAANRAANPKAVVINNASDEALLANILDPLIGCTPFTGPSLDDPGVNVPALALSEIQAEKLQAAPLGLVALNDPDCLLTSDGKVSVEKTNQYRTGVNQPVVNANDASTSGALVPYCNNMVAVQPQFLQLNMAKFLGTTTPDACVGTNLFTFMCNRFIMSLTQLTCPKMADPVTCKLDGNGVATSCTINLHNATVAATGTNMSAGM
jgi:hypothetical protein